ncbi:hypothetical protein H0A66_06050 [Alcaligenaceae bacterium]|nr:hypothetical protein [Alcaligenaceae bacterium]
MFFGNTTLLVIFVLGIIFSFIGFGLRDHNPGMVFMGIGFLAVLFAAINKAIEVFG